MTRVLAWSLILLAVAAALVLAWPRPPAESSAEVTFARDMSAHHLQAVGMSVTLFRRAADPEVRRLAQDIMLTQQAQVGQMSGWLMAWDRPQAGARPPMAGMDRAAMGLATPAQEASLETLPVRAAETQFLRLMRRHHAGGVAMAQAALEHLRRPETRAFASRVVVAQRAELGVLDHLLLQRGVAVPGLPTGVPENMPGMSHP
ncbi:DUF305 domain-containing protein [uncultured Deinococcus sp.]|uniref:DUF305 domain-containing protein n=1 Tax=uncultured Deinococcus sp. TaxID=158789 RepID=UPI002588AEBA|nr:DUF305 domain-containing protein [uncultured Deinococcus sp.]